MEFRSVHTATNTFAASAVREQRGSSITLPAVPVLQQKKPGTGIEPPAQLSRQDHPGMPVPPPETPFRPQGNHQAATPKETPAGFSIPAAGQAPGYVQAMTERAQQSVFTAMPPGNTLQAKLVTTKQENRELTPGDIQAQIDNFVMQYGESNREAITRLAHQYRDDRRIRSLRDLGDLIRSNVRRDAMRAQPLDLSESDRPMLPTGSTVAATGRDREHERTPAERRRIAIRHMEFTGVTVLTAKVFLRDGSSFVVEERNQDGKKNHGHAEMRLLGQIEAGVRSGEITQITITINNSPCGWCGPDLAAWKARNGDPKMVVHFTNAYGDNEEFQASVAAMQRAGIILHDFNPMDHVGSETDDEMETQSREGISIKDRFTRQVLETRKRLASLSQVPPEQEQQRRRQRGDDDAETVDEARQTEVPQFNIPGWDGRSLPHDVFTYFIRTGVNRFIVNGMVVTIRKYSETNIRFTVGMRGG